MDYQALLRKEYQNAGAQPLLITIDGKKLIVPYIYSLEDNLEKTKEAFLKDYKDTQAETPEKTAQKRYKKYCQAVSLTAEINKLDPKGDLITSLSKNHLKIIKEKRSRLIRKKMADKSARSAYMVGQFLAKGIKYTTKNHSFWSSKGLKRTVKKALLVAGVVGGIYLAGSHFQKEAPIAPQAEIVDVQPPKKEIKFSNIFKNQPKYEDKYGNLKKLDECADEICAILACMEGFYDKTFDDGTGTLTIGYGTTFYIDENGKTSKVQNNDTLTKDEATTQKVRYIAQQMRPIIANDVKRTLTENELKATIGLGFCIGPEGLKNSTYLRYINENKSDYEVSQAATLWNKQKGVPKRAYFLMALKDGYISVSDFLKIGWKPGENLYIFGLEDMYECQKDKKGNYIRKGRHACPVLTKEKFYAKIKFTNAPNLVNKLVNKCTCPVKDIIPSDMCQRINERTGKMMLAQNTKVRSSLPTRRN